MKRAYKIWMWPVWLIALFSQSNSFKGNPIIGSPLANKLGLHVVRLVLAHAITRLRWWMLSGLMPKDRRRQFHRDGFTVIDEVLSPAEFKALRREIDSAGLTTESEVRECIQGDTLTHRIFLDGQTLDALPVTRRLLSDPQISGALRYAAAKNCRPLHYLQAIKNGFNTARTKRSDPQKNLHSDTFHPTMKAWLFLEDVPLEKGPFTYVKGSNRLTWKRIKWEYQRSLIAANANDGYSEKGSFRFERDDLRGIDLPDAEGLAVKRNTLIIANTYGIHCRGAAEQDAHRLEIWSFSRFNPFNPWPGLGISLYSSLEYALAKKWWWYKDRKALEAGTLSSWHPISPQTFHQTDNELVDVIEPISEGQ